MRVLVTTYGSRGDVQPIVALTVALRNLGVEVAMCPAGRGVCQTSGTLRDPIDPGICVGARLGRPRAPVRHETSPARRRAPRNTRFYLPRRKAAMRSLRPAYCRPLRLRKRPPRFEVSISLVCISARGIC
ncbi:MAG: glycosyltransferase, partial [Xanthobacteraceae bacterium]